MSAPGESGPRSHRLAIRLDRHGRTMVGLTVTCLVLTAATLVASALDLIGPGKGAGAKASTSVLPYRDTGKPIPLRVDDLLTRMGPEDKLGQLIQVDRAALTTPDDVATYRIGSIASGPDSLPADPSATGWADMYDGFQRTAQTTALSIPVIYGTNAVHGHNNVRGATVFPHNIGLGATRDPELVKRVGRATAEEVAATGVDWTFAPCLCVARDDRSGRTYESFGEQPEIPAAMTSIVQGLQGPTLSDPSSVLATAKYLGDGAGTTEAELRGIHLPPFQAAISAGAGSVLVSLDGWNPQRAALVNDVLKGELRFSGFVLADGAGLDKLDGAPGVTGADITAAYNAGIDMIAAPGDFRQFVAMLRAEVDSGRITWQRVDDANRRILTKKFELGLFERPLSDRGLTANVGSTAHRDLAREAVRKSQVLLKNDDKTLPLAKRGGKIFVAGRSADDVGIQSGGWTMSSQGASGPVTQGTTILQGIRNAVGSGATITYNRDGTGINRTYRAAIAVVGEKPYAGSKGDRKGALALDKDDLRTLDRLRASGVPVVVVLVSGRPLDVASRLKDWDALVAAWLPGSEGQGVADVLFGDHAPTGKLPMTWMRTSAQQPINAGDGKPALFAYGFGLTFPAVPGATPTPTPSPTLARPASPTPTPTRSRTPAPPRTTPPSPTPRPDPTTPAPTPTEAATVAACTVEYDVTSQWATGFVADLRVTAGGSALAGWTVRFALPDGQVVSNAWNAAVSQSGAQVAARNLDWNGAVPASGSVSFGFQGIHNGTNAPPTAATVNGTSCAVTAV
jgi:beta-glucosidase